MRCGRQPYGVLPVTSLDLVAAAGGRGGGARRRTPGCEPCSSAARQHLARRVERSGAPRQPADPPTDADLADVMRTEALSSRYSARSLLGRHYLQHLRAFLGEDLATGWLHATQDAVAARHPAAAGLRWRPRLRRSVYADLMLARVRAAGAGGRGVALPAARAELHRGAAGGTDASTTSRRCTCQARGGRHAAAGAAAPRAAARVRERGGGDRRRRPARRWRCCCAIRARRPGHRRATDADLEAAARSARAAITGSKTIREHLESADGLHSSARCRARRIPRSLAHLQAATAKPCST